MAAIESQTPWNDFWDVMKSPMSFQSSRIARRLHFMWMLNGRLRISVMIWENISGLTNNISVS